MNLTKKPERQEYIIKEILFKDRLFMDKLLTFLFSFSDRIKASKLLSKNQIESLLNKFKEQKKAGKKLKVDIIFTYIKNQQDRDKTENNWAKKIEDKSYGYLLKNEFNVFKLDLNNNLNLFLSNENDALINEIKDYIKENENYFDFKLLEIFFQVFFKIELYGKAYYQELLQEGELKWEQI